jgi:pyruvate/2-oxoglutarate dehydrogenase complex dihydrolipoamide acyltransferase (E2) component
MKTQQVPQYNVNDTHVEFITALVPDFSYVEQGQSIVEVGTSKAVIVITAEHSGWVLLHGSSGEKMETRATLALFFDSEESCRKHPKTAPVQAVAQPKPDLAPLPAHGKLNVDGSPRERRVPPQTFTTPFTTTRLSRALATRIDSVRITERPNAGLLTTRNRDSSQGEIGGLDNSNATRPPISHSVNLTASAQPVCLRSEAIPFGKKVEIDNLRQGQSGNITSLLSIQFPSAGWRMALDRCDFTGSPVPFLYYEICQLLRENPKFTSFFEDGKIYYYDRVDLGVAIELERGLKVVTLRDADKLLPVDLAERLFDMSRKELEGTLGLEDLSPSTATVSDLSGHNILFFHPLINGQQSVVFGIGGDKYLPDFPMSVILTFDHRILTGREVSLFLGSLRTRIHRLMATG